MALSDLAKRIRKITPPGGRGGGWYLTRAEWERHVRGDRTAIDEAVARAEQAGLDGGLLLLPPVVSTEAWEEQLAAHRDRAAEVRDAYFLRVGLKVPEPEPESEPESESNRRTP